MSDKEAEIMRDAFRYLKHFADVPKLTDPGCDNYWANSAGVLAEVGNKWRQHPLAMKVMIALYEYLEIKQKELSK